jgi:hydroxylamine reductase (hybrid-cluster protein)
LKQTVGVDGFGGKGFGRGKCILMTGHDMHDLHELLKQTEGKVRSLACIVDFGREGV